MILFKNDWQKYSTAKPDTNTKNKSWLNLAALFKSMGVKNFYFHLALMQPDLEGVDPYSPDLTMEQKAKIAIECKYNFWYFVREVVRIPIDGGKSIPFIANRGVIACFFAFLCGVDFGLIMPRQTGKSVGVDVLKIWLLLFHLKNSEIFLFTKDTNLRVKNIKKMKDIIKELPPWLSPITKSDADNTEVITCRALNNVLWTAIGQPTKDGANKVGRGFTIPITHTDELAFIPNVQISLPALLAAGITARKNAKEADGLFGNIFTTTAGKKDSTEGAFAYDLIMSGMYWTEAIYDCENKEDARELVKINSHGLGSVINGTFSHRQLGYDDQWLIDAIAETRANEDTANRDLLNKWTSGSISSPLSLQLNEVISTSMVDPFYTSISADRYMMRWYIPESMIDKRLSEGHYVIGLDSSQAIGRDANALVIVDIRTMEIIATSIINEANIHKYAIWLAMFMIRYTNTTLILENKVSGQSIFDTIAATFVKYGINPFKRMYNTVVDNHTSREIDYKRIQGKDGMKEETYLALKGCFGFQTNSNRRSFLYDAVLQEAAKSTGHLIRDNTLVTEICSLVLKNGRVDHPAGGHDDAVIAWLMTHWFIKHSKNLSFYGIDTSQCLSMVSDEGALLSPEKLEERKQLAVIQMEINDLKNKLIAAPDIIETKKYEKLLSWKINAANKLGETTYSIDSILDDVKKNKVTKRSLRQALQDSQAQRNMRKYA